MKYFILLICVTIGLQTNAQKNNDSAFKDLYEANKTLLESGTFQFLVDLAFVERERKALKGEKHFTMMEKTALISLADLKDNAIETKGMVEDYELKVDDSRRNITFSCYVDGYKLKINIVKNGNAFLELSYENGTINYTGKLVGLSM